MSSFFSDNKGNKSSSRLSSFMVICFAMLIAQETLLFAYLRKADILMAAGAAGTAFITIAGPAMVFMFNQKKTEEKANG